MKCKVSDNKHYAPRNVQDTKIQQYSVGFKRPQQVQNAHQNKFAH
jgi:hypothetical protein